ncbi:MAG: hypothetical protein DCC55_25420 [Chloroflexi bacterium]|nr:MAG: hypothetical protein DCC55_25420 [Chloroflexota bacterium]
MSFVLQFRRLFSVFAQEESGSAILPGFSFAPSEQSRRLMTRHQLLFRARPGGCEVYYRLNPLAADPLLGRISNRVRFTLCMALGEHAFFARYEPDLDAETGPQLYLDNLTAAGAIQPLTEQSLSAGTVVQRADAVKVVPQLFFAPAESGSAGGATRFIVRDKFDPATVVLEAPIDAGPGVTQTLTRIDLSGHSPGPYTLETDATGATVRAIYADNALAGAKILGLVDIYWETPQDTTAPGGVAYLIRFRRR